MQNTENTHIFRWYISIITCFNPRSWLKVWNCLRISARGQQHSVGIQLKLYHWERKMVLKKLLQHVMINLFYKYFFACSENDSREFFFFEMWFWYLIWGKVVHFAYITEHWYIVSMLIRCYFQCPASFVIVFLMQFGFRAVVSSISFILLWFGNVLMWIQTLKSWQVCRGPQGFWLPPKGIHVGLLPSVHLHLFC